MSIRIPKTTTGAKTRLARLEQAYRLAGWERAAIIWAHTRSRGGRPAGDETPASAGVSAAEMGRRLGVSEDTVGRARKAWKWAMENANASDVKPDDEIDLPTIEYPPTELTSARYERNLRAAILAEPDALQEAVADPEVAQIVVKTVAKSDELTHAVLAMRIGIEQDSHTPAMGPAPRDRNHEAAEAIYTIGRLLRDERNGDWVPDGIIESMLRLLGISLADRHTKAQPDIFDQIDAHLASSKSRK